jgi:hypothetical protein
MVGEIDLSEASENVEDEDTQRKRVEELLGEGYTPTQIEKEWGFPHTTVWRVAKKRINPKAKAGKGNSDREILPKLPMVLKAGAGQEMISPEAIIQSYLLSDGDAGDWMFKGMMLLRAAQLMNLTDVEIMKGQADAQAKAIKPILDVMDQARRDMDAAAQRARESNAEIAVEAAAGAAARAVARIDEKFAELKQQKVDIATVQDPMKGLMARTMEMMMERMNAMLIGAPAGPTPGLVDKRVQK